jgi:catechol 2,3-dioxygenase-like lactoylglutathione lyase family enzyme
MDRRTMLKMSLATGQALIGGALISAAPNETARAADETNTPDASNPYAARPLIFTVATPDIEASIRFYRDLLDHDLIGRGVLDAHAPREVGAIPGRRYALLHALEPRPQDRGYLRLIETAPGAEPNRPASASVLDPGLAALNTKTGDLDASYARLTAAGVATISKPLKYSHLGVPALPGSTEGMSRSFEVTTYAAIGPAGERIYISRVLTAAGKPIVTVLPRQHGVMSTSSVMCLDRWPLWRFYDAAFGMKPTKDQYAFEDTLNTLIGASPDTYFRFGSMGDGGGIEWWEFRQAPPPGRVFATRLDRTGFALSTLLVDDLAAVRTRLAAASISILSQGALPLPEGFASPSLFVRGAVGELIEVIGRR